MIIIIDMYNGMYKYPYISIFINLKLRPKYFKRKKEKNWTIDSANKYISNNFRPIDQSHIFIHWSLILFYS